MRRIAAFAVVWGFALSPPLLATDPVVEEQAPASDAATRDVGSAAAPLAAPAAQPAGMGFGGVPALNYDADNGFGFGAVGTLYLYDGATRPYRTAITFQLFMTSNLVQDHSIAVDALRVMDLPLRIYSRAGYLQSLTQNYGGTGGTVTCDPAVARTAGEMLGLGGEHLEQFARRYYQRRFINPYGVVTARWALSQAPMRVEVIGGWRGLYFIPGNWFADDDGDGQADLTPYPNSLYADAHPDGEPGFLSAFQVGLMLDSRDNEPAPTRGWWIEGTARGAGPVTASTWSFAGANLTVRGYTAVDPQRRLVLANRLVMDVVVGDPPVQELVRVGGSLDYYVFGGGDMGRGIRTQRYIGKLRTLNQTEVRYRFVDFMLFEQRFSLTAAGFLDAGIVGQEIAAPGEIGAVAGGGGGLRLAWNENFVIRADVGVSPVEAWDPKLYILINNPF